MAIGWVGIVLGSLNLIAAILFAVIAVVAPPQPAAAPPGQLSPDTEMIINAISSVVGGAINLAMGVILVYGSRRMKRLESYRWALTAAWLSVLPVLSPCCILGLIFGIQAIQVLNNEDVKAAFLGEGHEE
jgi:hypothetical protein